MWKFEMASRKQNWRFHAIAAMTLASINAGLVIASRAADLPAPAPFLAKAPVRPPAYEWTGFYLGGGVGTRSSQVDGDVSPDSLANFGGGSGENCSSNACLGETFNDSALRGGLYLGYNYQFATQWLAGIEGDWGFGGKTTAFNNSFYPSLFISNFDGHDSFSVKTDWDASVRGRVGFLVTPSFLVYGTAGAAWQRLQATSNCSALAPAGIFPDLCSPDGFAFAPATITDTTTKIGWTIGAGIETMLWRNWIVRGEYRYADFGTITNTDTRTCLTSLQICGSFGPASPLVITDTLRLRTQTVTFGLAYKFGQ